MNVALFLTPKANVVWLYEDTPVRQALETLRACGYAAVPVLGRDGQYIGTVGEGDFLWYINDNLLPCRDENCGEGHCVHDIMCSRPNPAVLITAGIDELINSAVNHNFVPVVDDRNVFIGIVTRKAIIANMLEKTAEIR